MLWVTSQGKATWVEFLHFCHFFIYPGPQKSDLFGNRIGQKKTLALRIDPMIFWTGTFHWSGLGCPETWKSETWKSVFTNVSLKLEISKFFFQERFFSAFVMPCNAVSQGLWTFAGSDRGLGFGGGFVYASTCQKISVFNLLRNLCLPFWGYFACVHHFSIPFSALHRLSSIRQIDFVQVKGKAPVRPQKKCIKMHKNTSFGEDAKTCAKIEKKSAEDQKNARIAQKKCTNPPNFGKNEHWGNHKKSANQKKNGEKNGKELHKKWAKKCALLESLKKKTKQKILKKAGKMWNTPPCFVFTCFHQKKCPWVAVCGANSIRFQLRIKRNCVYKL